MKVTVDTKQRINGALTFVLEFYKILMGSFLTVFVPRDCDGESCSVSQNIFDDDVYHIVCLFVNLASFTCFAVFYYGELRRENWCISYLDIDPNKTANNLDTSIERYPKFKKEMKELNVFYKNTILACIISQVVNIVMSAIDIGFNNLGMVSITPMLSYIILILTKLAGANTIAKASLENERAYSAYLGGAKTYNSIDMDHRLPEDKTGEEEDTGAMDLGKIVISGVNPGD